MERFNDVEM